MASDVGVADDTNVSEARPRRRWVPVALFLGIAAILFGVAIVGENNPYTAPTTAQQAFAEPSILDGWYQFDAGWYNEVATSGYHYSPGVQSSVAFFPTFPMTLKALNTVFSDSRISGFLITIIAGLISTILFAGWVRERLPRRAANIALLGILLYPYSLFLFGAVYGDALFLATALGAFVLLDRGHPIWAGLVGALAAAGRPVGVAVAVGLVIRLLEIRARELPPSTWTADGTVDGPRAPLMTRAGRLLKGLRWPDAGILLAGGGLAAYMGYLWIAFGDPFAFASVQEAWGQEPGPRTWFKVQFFESLSTGSVAGMVHLAVPGILCIVGLALMPLVRRTFGWGYCVYALLTVGIPFLETKDFMGTGRYLMVAFPVVAAAALLVSRSRFRWLAPVLLTICGIGLVICTFLYSRGYPLS